MEVDIPRDAAYVSKIESLGAIDQSNVRRGVRNRYSVNDSKSAFTTEDWIT
jgi:hypothetical protein